MTRRTFRDSSLSFSKFGNREDDKLEYSNITFSINLQIFTLFLEISVGFVIRERS